MHESPWPEVKGADILYHYRFKTGIGMNRQVAVARVGQLSPRRGTPISDQELEPINAFAQAFQVVTFRADQSFS